MKTLGAYLRMLKGACLVILLNVSVLRSGHAAVVHSISPLAGTLGQGGSVNGGEGMESASASPGDAEPVTTRSRLEVISPSEAGFVVQHWGIAEGLPLDRIEWLAQTQDGFLWVATDSQGLSRFDGHHFKNLNPINTPTLPGWNVRRLVTDSKGRMWIYGSERLALWERDQIRMIDPSFHGLLARDSQGGMVVLDQKHPELRRYDGDEFEILSSDQSEFPWPEEWRVTGMACDRWNRVWGLVGPQTELWELGVDKPVRCVVDAFDERKRAPYKCLVPFHGGVGLMTGMGWYVRGKDGWILQRKYPKKLQGRFHHLSVVCTASGDLWISNRQQGLIYWPMDGYPKEIDFLPQFEPFVINQLLEDANGNIWVATLDGLYQFRPAAFRTLIPDPELSPRIMDLDCGPDGSILISQAHRFYRFQPNQTGVGTPALVGASAIYRVLSAGLDGQAFGTRGGDDLYGMAWDEDRGSPVTKKIWTSPNGIGCTHVSRSSTLWVGTASGLFRREASEFSHVPLPGTRPRDVIVAFEEQEDGRLFALARSGGVYVLQDGKWEHLSSAVRQDKNFAVGLTVTPEGTVWVAFRSLELACYENGVWRNFDASNLDLPVGAMGIVSDLQGGLWWNTHAEGVFHLDSESALKLARGESSEALTIRFGKEDGLLSLAGDGYEQTPVRDQAGRIWVPTSVGASVIDPPSWRHRHRMERPPQLYLDAVRLDGVLYRSGTDGGKQVVVPAGTARVDVDCAFIELNHPRRAFLRHRLVGYDRDWTTVRDLPNLHYQKLPPGDYVLEVQAANQFLKWGEVKPLMVLAVQPFWWQRPSLQASGGCAVLLLGILAYRMRMKSIRQKQAMQEAFSRGLMRAQEEERKRIASDLHDSLGQNLLIAKNQLDLVREQTNDGVAQEKLQQVADSVGSALEEARTISHQLRPFHLHRLGLSKAIRSVCRQVADSTRIPIECRIASVDQLLAPESEVLVYRIVQEALNNIIKHADASKAEVEMKQDARGILLVVQDDGRGFDKDKVYGTDESSRGLGLVGLQERTHLLHGHFHCHSVPGHGTILTFEIPVREMRSHEA